MPLTVGHCGNSGGLRRRLNPSLRGPRNDDRSRERSINEDPARDGNTLDRRRLVRSSGRSTASLARTSRGVRGRTAPPVPTTSVVPLIRCADLRCTQVIEARFAPDGQSVRSQPLPQIRHQMTDHLVLIHFCPVHQSLNQDDDPNEVRSSRKSYFSIHQHRQDG
jgi:hypothetical protein